MQMTVFCLVVALFAGSVLCQRVDEERCLLASQLTAIQTLCNAHDNTPSTSTNCIRCEPGDRGPKGERGNRGRRGPAGVVNERRLDALHSEFSRLQSENAALKVKVEKLERRSDMRRMNGMPGGCPKGIIYESSCYFVLGNGTYRFEAAKTACADLGAHLAYIDTPEVYDAVSPYMRQALAASGRSYDHFFFGAEYTGLGERIKFLDGRAITWTHDWGTDCPQQLAGFPGYTAMAWLVHTSWSSSEGFWNYPPLNSFRALCQI